MSGGRILLVLGALGCTGTVGSEPPPEDAGTRPAPDAGVRDDGATSPSDSGFALQDASSVQDAAPPAPGPSCRGEERCFYVTPDGSGSLDGSDWSHALAGLPASLVRGATYMLAGGEYPAYSFATPEDGTAVITIRKATVLDHGSESGWVPSYGSTQAVFAEHFAVFRSYFVLDGQTRDEADWFDGDAYGFKIQSQGGWEELPIRDRAGARALTDITIRYLHIAAVVGLPTEGGVRVFTIDTDTFDSTLRHTNGLFSRIYIDGGNNPFMVRGFVDPIVEYSASTRTCSNATYHGEVVNLFYTHRGGGVIRYNHFKNAYDGSAGCPAGSTGVIAIAETSGVEIYGNVFEDFSGGNGAIAAPWSNDNVLVYNNTFVRSRTITPIVDFPNAETGGSGTGNFAYNNLCVDCDRVIYRGIGTFANNGVETQDAFVDFDSGDYRLARPTTTEGMPLAGPFDRDRAGRPRGEDGYWDIGAYEH